MCQNEPNPESQIKDFRGFSSFRESWEMQPMAFFILPNIGKAVFRRFSFIVPLRKPPFPVFRSSYPYESFFFPFFVHRTPTKASFCHFSFVVPLRKLLFVNFRSSYPYESFFLSIFVHRTPTKASFSRFLSIVPRT